MHAPVKFHEYIPHLLEVMTWTLSGMYGQTDGQTDGRMGQTGVTLNAFTLFFEWGDIKIPPRMTKLLAVHEQVLLKPMHKV